MENFKDKLKKYSRLADCPLLWEILILVAIILASAFLQTYNLREWLDFGDDQVHDAILVEKTVRGENGWPLLGPDMSSSGTDGGGRENRFHIGPAYYYMQIASAKIFGGAPDKLAYPDILFSILSIPLFYLFLKKYFEASLSLAITWLYSISFYSLSFSHSAWNPHLIPFFAILFLLSAYEFILAENKVRWIWIISLGIALGVGIQLHAIMLVLMPLFLFFIFVYSLWKNRSTWKKWLAVALIAVAFNLPQIASEFKTDFSNSKAFLKSIRNTKEESWVVEKTARNIDCHFQANGYMISSLGGGNCRFSFANLFERRKPEGYLREIKNPLTIIKILAAAVFSFLGYFFLFGRYRKEHDARKKVFLGVVILYAILAFLVMLPVIEEPLRYFIHLFFVPYIFLGLIIQWLGGKFKFGKKWAALFIFTALAALNAGKTYTIAKEFNQGARSSQNAIALGEMEKMADYIIAQSNAKKSAYLGSSKKCANFYRPLMYVAEKHGFDLLKDKDDGEIPPDANVFYLIRADSSENKDNLKDTESKKFGQVIVYKLR